MEPEAETAQPARSSQKRLPAIAGALLFGLVPFLLMANERQVPHGALWGGLGLLASVLFGLRALGLLQRASAFPELPSLASKLQLSALPGEARLAAPLIALPLALVAVLATAIFLGGHALPYAIALGLLSLVPAALRRPGWLAQVVPALILLPLLGSYGLWDPWETHYGEVSREILSRDDWISLWWAQDRWFWSKPIYIFWSEALTWSASGVGFLPDSNFQHSEWVLRLPIFVVSMAALLAVYVAVARRFGPRAGCLSSIALATTPYFAFLARQAVTDMPFVGLMTVAMMLLLLAVHEEPEAEAPRFRTFGHAIGAQELVLGLFWLLAIPQVLYLASRNITLTGDGFAWHKDIFMVGSGHNPSVPGNVGIRDQGPWASGLAAQPLAQALLWALGIAAVTYMLRRERRMQSLWMFAFYVVCALAFMAKGIPGFALPGLVAFMYLLTCRRFDLLFEGRLRVAAGALTLLTVAMPWFVAMFIRHGPGFTDRLLVHDHINRLTKGVHGDTGSVQYFVQQLGYGMFPWVALLPAALAVLVSWPKPEESGTERKQRELIAVVGLWFIATFTLFSAMTTKFHHYIFPAVPAAAILTGLLLDRMLGRVPLGGRAGVPATLLALIAPLPLVLGTAGLFGDVRGIQPDKLGMAERAVWSLQHRAPVGTSAAFLLAGGLALVIALLTHARRARTLGAQGESTSSVSAGALIAGALVCAFVGRDLSWVTAERPAGYERLIHLFVYNYDRPWPAQFDYRAILTGFAIVATLLVFGAALRGLRPVLTLSFMGTAVLFTLWCVDVYMIDLSPHWGQQELFERYYKERKSRQEPIVAWQMNWKGENLYSGNRVAVFASLNNDELSGWLERNKGKRAFFVLEHKRLDRFKRLMGTRKVEPRSTERENNKFVLVRVLL